MFPPLSMGIETSGQAMTPLIVPGKHNFPYQKIAKHLTKEDNQPAVLY
jgi:hypothetical protein